VNRPETDKGGIAKSAGLGIGPGATTLEREQKGVGRPPPGVGRACSDEYQTPGATHLWIAKSQIASDLAPKVEGHPPAETGRAALDPTLLAPEVVLGSDQYPLGGQRPLTHPQLGERGPGEHLSGQSPAAGGRRGQDLHGLLRDGLRSFGEQAPLTLAHDSPAVVTDNAQGLPLGAVYLEAQQQTTDATGAAQLDKQGVGPELEQRGDIVGVDRAGRKPVRSHPGPIQMNLVLLVGAGKKSGRADRKRHLELPHHEKPHRDRLPLDTGSPYPLGLSGRQQAAGNGPAPTPLHHRQQSDDQNYTEKPSGCPRHRGNVARGSH
jgi:hypothetical protein